jgi:UDP-glucose:(heptosyl)LPS alpha-1,3-glucosyltransferase
MKIALVIEDYDPARGGVEQWTHQFARQLSQWGHELHIVARRFAPIFDHSFVRHYVPRCRSRLAFAEAVETKLRSIGADVIHDTGAGWHAHVFQPHGGSRLASFHQNLQLIPAWARPAKVQAARLLPRYREFEQLLARQYLDDGRLILALSKMVAHDLQRWHGVSRERIRVVYNGVDTVRFSPLKRAQFRQPAREQLGLRDGETLLLIVAHNLKLKGVPTLIRAAGSLHREGFPVRVAVVGGTPGRRYHRLVAQCGIADAVQFVGAVADPLPYYAAADIYVQPTFYDPCSLVALEALAIGLPVVTTRFNGAGELITEGVEGHIVNDPANPSELADVLRPLFDAQRRELMSNAARKLAVQHTLERNCREILAVYQEFCLTRRHAA